tara:strand:+ start:1863 stop:2324 length:462 start_codon:yes stop_codon:yes gene_type:complete
MAHPQTNGPQKISNSPPPQTIILESSSPSLAFQTRDRAVNVPQQTPFQLLEPMPPEIKQKSLPMFILGFFTPFVVWFLTMFVLDVTWNLFGRRVSYVLSDASCYALPLLYIGTLIYSFTKGSSSFGKGLLTSAIVPIILIGGLILILYIQYGI